MRLFGRRNRRELENTEDNAEQRPDSERVPASIGATCLGEACPNFKGEACDDTSTDWITAKTSADSKGKFDKPPFQDETIYVEYGQVCLRGTGEEDLVGLHYVIYDPEQVNMMQIVAYSGRFGEKPVSIRTHDDEVQGHLRMIASSDETAL